MNALEKTLLWIGAAGTFGTGAIYAWMKYLLTTDDPYAVVNHPLQPLFLKLHILVAPVLVFAVGLVFTQHIWKQWRSGRPAGRRSGIVTLWTVVPMVATGYLIQAVTGRTVLAWMIGIHLVTGAVYFLMFASHQTLMQVRERARRREARARMSAVRPDDEEGAA